MGMAASQARLLSITSRMADNELRSQMINNAKMRLTSESSQVSEKYLAALNETQLKFSNYSLTGEQQFQNLSFNSLTAYSAYNNQYGLRNRVGQILVSETDSLNFRTAKTKNPSDDEEALTEFLKSYGIEKTTTYFEKLPDSTEFNLDENTTITVGKDEFKDLYGVDGQNYETLLKSVEYATYNQLVVNYNTAEDSYNAATRNIIQKQLENTKFDGSTTYKDELKKFQEFSAGLYDGEGNMINPGTQVTSAGNFRDYIKKIVEDLDAINGYNGLIAKKDNEGNSAFLKTIKGNDYYNLNITDIGKKEEYSFLTDGSSTIGSAINVRYNASGVEVTPTIYYECSQSDTGAIKLSGEKYISATKPTDYDGQLYLVYDNSETAYKKDESGKLTTSLLKDSTNKPTDFDASKSYILIDKHTITNEEFVEGIVSLWNYVSNNIAHSIDLSDDAVLSENDKATITTLKNTRDEAKKNLDEFVFGKGSTDTLSGTNLNSIDEVMKYIFSTNPAKTTTNDFETILNIYKCELMLDEYGVPKYTYIDLNNPDENADAKAQWYINLFNRMNDGGYETIENGLASSHDWLKFALESGQVTMEQVNKDQRWVSTMYSNCSNITESAIDIDITVAEAEYNQAMKKIEAKDKRYDMELKNIDTEHQSLQTEYDSIKTAIDKNVERNFKFFTA